MEGPGLSLFLGSENIQLNTNIQDLEEDEEQEDAKQRNKEVHLLLLYSFLYFNFPILLLDLQFN